MGLNYPVNMERGYIDAVLGGQRGDEGKGRFVDMMAREHDVVARFNGGPNAGHTISTGDMEVGLHQVPSGILYPEKFNIVGNGSYIDPLRFLEEMAELEEKGLKITPDNLAISSGAHLILPHHIIEDIYNESQPGAQGSTKRGVSRVASDKFGRSGIRCEFIKENPAFLFEAIIRGLDRAEQMGAVVPERPAKIADEWIEEAKKLAPFITDTTQAVHDRLEAGETILAEGAQAYLLDIDHGMYPYVTSSNTSIGGVLNGLGVGPEYINDVVMVAKAVKSHVGGGPFVTELQDEELTIQVRGPVGEIDSEYGVSTKRPRRIGYLDIPELRSAARVNGTTELALSKLDYLTKFGRSVLVAVAYEHKGRRLEHAPSSAFQLEQCRPVYEELGLWEEDISSIRRFIDLPPAAQQMVRFIEEQVGVDIRKIGVGPQRDQVVNRDPRPRTVRL